MPFTWPPIGASVLSYTAVGADKTDQLPGTKVSAGLRLLGYTVKETAAAAASFAIQDSTTADTTKNKAVCALLASTGKEVWFGPQGIPLNVGLTVDWQTGAFDLCIYYAYMPAYG